MINIGRVDGRIDLTLATCILPQCLMICSRSGLTRRIRDLKTHMLLETASLTDTRLFVSRAHRGAGT
jgi:hypothetical protein